MKNRIIIIIGIIIAAIALIVLGYKFGWRLFGFRFCVHPNANHITEYEIMDNEVRLKGAITNSAQKYDGYKWKIKDGVLYFGVHGKVLFSSSKYGFFDITIDTPEKIQKIVIKGNGEEREIYSVEEE